MIIRNEITITREAQGRSREAGSEGSVNQTDEPTYRNGIGGSDSGRAGQGSRSPSGKTGGVNAVVASGKYMELPGEICAGGAVGFQTTHSTPCTVASNGDGIACAEVSRRHSNRRYGRGVAADGISVQRRVTYEPRSGKGLKPYDTGTPMGNALINADRRASEQAYRIQPCIALILVWVKATALKQTA